MIGFVLFVSNTKSRILHSHRGKCAEQDEVEHRVELQFPNIIIETGDACCEPEGDHELAHCRFSFFPEQIQHTEKEACKQDDTDDTGFRDDLNVLIVRIEIFSSINIGSDSIMIIDWRAVG